MHGQLENLLWEFVLGDQLHGISLFGEGVAHDQALAYLGVPHIEKDLSVLVNSLGKALSFEDSLDALLHLIEREEVDLA